MRLSVLITYHNERAWLTHCLRSLLDQPGKPDEVIVCDDASSAPPAQFIPSSSSIRVIRNETNLGPAKSRNRLMREATGDYIHFHDSDDWFEPAWCEAIREAIDASPDVVVTDVAHSDKSGVIARKTLGLSSLGEDTVVASAVSNAFLIPCLTYRRDLALELGGFNEALWQSEDYEFHVRLLTRASSITIIADDLVHVRHHEANRSKDRVDVWRSALTAIETLEPGLPPQYRSALALKAFFAASVLLQERDTVSAKRAFRLARDLNGGTVPYPRAAMRLLSRLIGPIAAEKIAAFYRDKVLVVL
jgi:glycosyltransferase involved in cell wall biosynthesis